MYNVCISDVKVVLIQLYLIRYMYWTGFNSDGFYIHRCGLDGHNCDALIEVVDPWEENIFDIGKLTKISGTLCVENYF